MKAVITGAGGFIGSHTAEYMAGKGNEVVAIDNLSRASLLKSNLDMSYNWRHLEEIARIRRLKGDILNPNSALKEVGDCDAIIHTAAQTAVTTSIRDPATDMKINLIGTLNVLEAARKAKTEPVFVYCST